MERLFAEGNNWGAAFNNERSTCPKGNNHEKALIAEDSMLIRKTISHLLVSEGFETVEAGDGKTALDLYLHHQPFDLVVTDIIMPGLDGIELTRQIREHSTDVPVIVVTSAADPRYVTSARDAGATDYLVKPLNQKHLREKIQRIVEPVAN